MHWFNQAALVSVLTVTPILGTELSPQYVDADDYFMKEAEGARWWAVKDNLQSAFNAICGDTFCEGAFENFVPVGLYCSVHRTTGAFKECLWTFVGSTRTVDPHTGEIRVEAKTFECHLPARGTLVTSLTADPARPLSLEGLLGREGYKALTTCLP
jgi:hypothetical protein